MRLIRCRPVRVDRAAFHPFTRYRIRILPNFEVAHILNRPAGIIGRVFEVTRSVAHHQLPLPLGHLEDADIKVLGQRHDMLRLIVTAPQFLQRTAHDKGPLDYLAHHQLGRFILFRPPTGRQRIKVRHRATYCVCPTGQVDHHVIAPRQCPSVFWHLRGRLVNRVTRPCD